MFSDDAITAIATCAGVPVAILVIPGGPAPVPLGRSAAISSGSQLGPSKRDERQGVSSLRSRKRRGSLARLLYNNASAHCRIPFPDLRTQPSLYLRSPSVHHGLSYSRYCPCARKLVTDQEDAIRARVATRSLSFLAAELGVSLETIRAVVRLHHLLGIVVPPSEKSRQHGIALLRREWFR